MGAAIHFSEPRYRGVHVGGIVGKDVKRLDLYRVYDTIPSWALDMVQELITGTNPEEFTSAHSTTEVSDTAKRLHENGLAVLFSDKEQ